MRVLGPFGSWGDLGIRVRMFEVSFICVHMWPPTPVTPQQTGYQGHTDTYTLSLIKLSRCDPTMRQMARLSESLDWLSLTTCSRPLNKHSAFGPSYCCYGIFTLHLGFRLSAPRFAFVQSALPFSGLLIVELMLRPLLPLSRLCSIDCHPADHFRRSHASLRSRSYSLP